MMAELANVMRKYSSHASSADNSDSHVDSPFNLHFVIKQLVKNA